MRPRVGQAAFRSAVKASWMVDAGAGLLIDGFVLFEAAALEVAAAGVGGLDTDCCVAGAACSCVVEVGQGRGGMFPVGSEGRHGFGARSGGA